MKTLWMSLPSRQVLIKDRSCALFYTGLDQWTCIKQKALFFATADDAAQLISRAALKNVEIVSGFDI
jgi:hypothetical protein